jgi:hypothetical protein
MPKRLLQQKSGFSAGSFDPLALGHMWMIEQGALPQGSYQRSDANRCHSYQPMAAALG